MKTVVGNIRTNSETVVGTVKSSTYKSSTKTSSKKYVQHSRDYDEYTVSRGERNK